MLADDYKASVLVLMTSFNGSDWIYDQVQSVLNQVNINVSIIISDDCSSDNTIDIINKISSLDSRVQLIEKKLSSKSASKNFYSLFRSADIKGYDFVAYADQDDIWHPKKMINAVEKIINNSASGYSCSATAFWTYKKKTQLLKNSRRITASDFLFESAGQGCTYVFPSASFKKIKLFCLAHKDEELLFYHDWLSYLLVRSWNERWYFDKKSWIHYRQHQANQIGSRGSLKAIIRRLNLIKNGWYKEQIKLAIDIFLSQNSSNEKVNNFNIKFIEKNSIKRKLFLIIFFIKNGRRKPLENIIIIISIAIGWI